MGAPKPQATKAPYEQNNEYGFESLDPNNPWVQAYTSLPIDVDPGVSRRTQLQEQASTNRWNNAFTAGIPDQIRMAMQGNEQRQIQQQGSADRRQAEYAANQLKLARAERLLPQLVQKRSSGYNTQVSPGQPGFWSSFARGAGGALGGGLFGL